MRTSHRPHPVAMRSSGQGLWESQRAVTLPGLVTLSSIVRVEGGLL